MSGTCIEKRYKELTAREWWIQEIFGSRPCDTCGDKPINVLAHITVPESRLKELDPIGLVLKRYGEPVAYKPMLAIEKYFVVGQVAACSRCQKAMEQMLAHRSSSNGMYGSSAYITFDRPPENKLIITA